MKFEYNYCNWFYRPLNSYMSKNGPLFVLDFGPILYTKKSDSNVLGSKLSSARAKKCIWSEHGRLHLLATKIRSLIYLKNGKRYQRKFKNFEFRGALAMHCCADTEPIKDTAIGELQNSYVLPYVNYLSNINIGPRNALFLLNIMKYWKLLR